MDGILAFFPTFYSGRDAGYLAVKAAEECHEVFETEYRANRRCFRSIRRDADLGIGIDYGEVALVTVWAGITVVGSPVVYACRIGGAPVGITLVNEQAYVQLLEKHSAYCMFDETVMNIKNEGDFVAYRVRLNERKYEAELPEWMGKEVAAGEEIEALQKKNDGVDES